MQDRELEITELWLKYLEESGSDKTLRPEVYLKRYPQYEKELRALLNFTEVGQIIVGQDLSKLTGPMKETIWQKAQEKLAREAEPEKQKALARECLAGASETFAKGDYPATRELLDKAIAIHRRFAESGPAGRPDPTLLSWLGFEYSIMGFMAQAEAADEKTPEKADKTLDEALEYYRKAGSYYQEISEKKGVIACLINSAMVFWQKHDFVKARPIYKKVIKLSEEANDDEALATASLNLGVIQLIEGNYRASHLFSQRALEVSRKINNREIMAMAYNNLGEMAAVAGGHKHAMEYYHKSLEVSRETKDYRMIAQTAGALGSLYANHLHWEEASQCYNEAANAVDQLSGASGHPTAVKFRRALGSFGMPSTENVLADFRRRIKEEQMVK